MYYQIKVQSSFSAAHRVLSLPQSPCYRLHGHNFALEVTVGASHLTNGFVCDFYVLKQIIDTQIISILDHQYINDLPQFKGIDPTCEHIAQWIYQTISKHISTLGARLIQISLAENNLFQVILTEEEPK